MSALCRIAVLAAAVALVLTGCGDDAETTSVKTLAGGEEAAAIAVVLQRIDAGEPSPFEQDGTTFQNREGLLPDQPLGYYREYTVETPGSPDRGARRLVIGEQGETYYTDDHYESFERIDPEDYR